MKKHANGTKLMVKRRSRQGLYTKSPLNSTNSNPHEVYAKLRTEFNKTPIVIKMDIFDKYLDEFLLQCISLKYETAEGCIPETLEKKNIKYISGEILYKLHQSQG